MVLGVLEIALVLGIACFREILGRLAFQNNVHEVGERARRRHATRYSLGVAVIAAIAEPDGNGKLRGDAAEPAIHIILRRSRLACRDLTVRKRRSLAGAFRDDALHDLGCRMGNFCRNGPLALWCRVVDHDRAVVVDDALDALGVVVRAAVRDGRVRVRHLKRCHRFGTERERPCRSERRGNSHAFGDIDDLIRANREDKPRERRVRRHREGVRDALRPIVGMVDVGNFPSGELRSCRSVDHGIGVDALLDSCHQGERLERRTCLPARPACPGSHVDLRGVVVLAADKRLDVAVVGIDRHHGDLVVVTRRLLLLARSRLGSLLHGNIKRGVYLQPALEKLVFGVRVLAVGVGQLVAHVAREVRIRLDSRG